MRRAVVAQVTCASCNQDRWGVVIAAEAPDEKAPELVELCVVCLDEMFAVTKLLQMRLRRPASTHSADYGPDWTKTHDAILVRDGYECQDDEHQMVRGATLGASLVVHHIKPLKKFNGDYISANQPENLITLCSLCHGKWHGRLRKAKIHK